MTRKRRPTSDPVEILVEIRFVPQRGKRPA